MALELQKESPAQQLTLSEEWDLLRRPEDSRYPRVFGISKLFIPGKNREKGDTIGWDKNAGAKYEVGDFKIERWGPGLSTYDEDTLIAILQICCTKKLRAPSGMTSEQFSSNMPSNMPDASLYGFKENVIFVGDVSPYRINKYINREVSGNSLKLCYESIVRLSMTQLFIQRKDFPKIVDTKFFYSVRDKSFLETSRVYIDPLMAAFLSEFVTIDLSIRKELTPTGKAVYRYLESSGITTLPVTELMEKIGTTLSLPEFKRLLVGREETDKKKGVDGELDTLKKLGWLESWKLEGTGRSQPFMLEIVKANTPAVEVQ